MSQLRDEISLKHDSGSKEKLLVFFITGNPGLIEYYRSFLTLCYDSLRSKHKDLSISVYGTSLAGFEVSSSNTKEHKKGPWDLEQQIRHVDQTLTSQATAEHDGTPPRVILIGHSVGSYILLEVLRRQKARSATTTSNDEQGARIIGGICLFPTVTHIAQSPSGKKFSPFFAIPYFALVAGLLVNLVLSRAPFHLLCKLVALVTGFPPQAAAVTAAFIQSRGGVRQALHLAAHEMATITSDKWDDELWGVAGAEAGTGGRGGQTATKLFFLFGSGDHWVADETRDELIAARAARTGEGESRPWMEIDGTGIPHGFCISEFDLEHNEPVVRKVVEYIGEAVRTYW